MRETRDQGFMKDGTPFYGRFLWTDSDPCVPLAAMTATGRRLFVRVRHNVKETMYPDHEAAVAAVDGFFE